MLATASLELKAEKKGAHDDFVLSVAFSPDGKTIVSGSRDKPEKQGEAGSPKGSRDKPEKQGDAGSPKGSRDKPEKQGDAGSPNLKVWDAGASRLIPLNPQPKTDHSPACCSISGPQGAEARAQQPRALRGLLP